MKKILLGIIIGITIVGIGGYLYWQSHSEKVLAGVINKVATDLIGTRVGSTTTPIPFNITIDGGDTGQSATATYPFFTGGKDRAVVSLNIGNASTSAEGGSNVQISILGSNDYGCNTATTTTIYDILTVSEVEWFDASKHLANSSVITSFNNGTSTLVWDNPISGDGRELIFENLNAECLALQISGSSTEVYSRYRTK